MELSLERGDLLQLNPISSRGTLRLLPLGKKNKVKTVKFKEFSPNGRGQSEFDFFVKLI